MTPCHLPSWTINLILTEVPLANSCTAHTLSTCEWKPDRYHWALGPWQKTSKFLTSHVFYAPKKKQVLPFWAFFSWQNPLGCVRCYNHIEQHHPCNPELCQDTLLLPVASLYQVSSARGLPNLDIAGVKGLRDLCKIVVHWMKTWS